MQIIYRQRFLIFVFSSCPWLLPPAGIPALGQDADHALLHRAAGTLMIGASHHLAFSNPGTREDAVTNGKLDKWQKITSDPRYRLQLQKRSMGTSVVTRGSGFRRGACQRGRPAQNAPFSYWFPP